MLQLTWTKVCLTTWSSLLFRRITGWRWEVNEETAGGKMRCEEGERGEGPLQIRSNQDQRVASGAMDQSVVSRTLLPVSLSILLFLPSTTSLDSLSLTTSLTTLSILTPSAMSSSANFCPVEGTDYMTDGNMIKVIAPSVRSFSSDNDSDTVLLLSEIRK